MENDKKECVIERMNDMITDDMISGDIYSGMSKDELKKHLMVKADELSEYYSTDKTNTVDQEKRKVLESHLKTIISKAYEKVNTVGEMIYYLGEYEKMMNS